MFVIFSKDTCSKSNWQNHWYMHVGAIKFTVHKCTCQCSSGKHILAMVSHSMLHCLILAQRLKKFPPFAPVAEALGKKWVILSLFEVCPSSLLCCLIATWNSWMKSLGGLDCGVTSMLMRPNFTCWIQPIPKRQWKPWILVGTQLWDGCLIPTRWRYCQLTLVAPRKRLYTDNGWECTAGWECA